MSLTSTPRANQLHIGIFGKRNSGKSSLINAITGQSTAIVSDVAGTTADPVYKTMEIYGIGPCVFIDTAGFDDVGELGQMRVDKTRKAAERTDIALMVFSDSDIKEEIEWAKALKKQHTPVIAVVNKADVIENADEIIAAIEKNCGLKPIVVSAREKTGIEKIRDDIIRLLPEEIPAPRFV